MNVLFSVLKIVRNAVLHRDVLLLQFYHRLQLMRQPVLMYRTVYNAVLRTLRLSFSLSVLSLSLVVWHLGPKYCWCYRFRGGGVCLFMLSCLFALYEAYYLMIIASQHWWSLTCLAALRNLKLFVINYVNFHCPMWKIHSCSSFLLLLLLLLPLISPPPPPAPPLPIKEWKLQKAHSCLNVNHIEREV